MPQIPPQREPRIYLGVNALPYRRYNPSVTPPNPLGVPAPLAQGSRGCAPTAQRTPLPHRAPQPRVISPSVKPLKTERVCHLPPQREARRLPPHATDFHSVGAEGAPAPFACTASLSTLRSPHFSLHTPRPSLLTHPPPSKKALPLREALFSFCSLNQPGGQVMSRPASTWKCRCGTL